MKVLIVCDECSELHKQEAICILVFGTDGILKMYGVKNISLDRWDTLARQLPEMVRHEHIERRGK